MISEQAIDCLERLSETGLPPPGCAHMIDVGTMDFVEYFDKEVLEDFVSRGGATCRIFQGAYGAGKSHLLQLIENNAISRGMIVAKTDLSHALGLDDWRAITKHILEHCRVEIGGERVESLPLLLERYGEFVDNTDVLREIRYPHPGFARAMHHALTSSYPSDAAREKIHQYLLGEKTRVADFQKFRLKRLKNPLSKKNAEHILRTLTLGLAAVGISGVVLLFDENEKTLSVRGTRVTKKVRVTANTMRRLIDAFATGRISHVVTVFAVLPGFMERATQAYEALGQRVDRVFDASEHAGWRMPFLELEEISSVPNPKEFVERVSERFADLIDKPECAQDLKAIGIEVVSEFAGTDYRRPLIKSLATEALMKL